MRLKRPPGSTRSLSLVKDFGVEPKKGKPLLLPQMCETWGDPESLHIVMFSPLPLLLTRGIPRWRKIEGGSRKWVLSHLVDSLSVAARDVCFLYSHHCVISFTYTGQDLLTCFLRQVIRQHSGSGYEGRWPPPHSPSLPDFSFTCSDEANKESLGLSGLCFLPKWLVKKKKKKKTKQTKSKEWLVYPTAGNHSKI